MRVSNKPCRWFALAVGIASSGAPGACTGPARDPGPPPPSVTHYPRAADRFMMLIRRQLTDADPVQTEQEINCEGERMVRALGPGEAAARIRSALDTAYPHHRDSVALVRVGRMLGGLSFGADPDVCDSLIAAADRVDPIVPVTQRPAQP